VCSTERLLRGEVSPIKVAMEGNQICILDDDPSVLRSLKELLESDDFEAKMFDDANEFLDFVRINTVRLAVLDVWMPRLSGLEVQERLHHLSPETKVITITGREDPAVRTRALELGAFTFLAKPLDSETFLDSVRAALGDLPNSNDTPGDESSFGC
jgi:FixJ family two-component response regulator